MLGKAVIRLSSLCFQPTNHLYGTVCVCLYLFLPLFLLHPFLPPLLIGVLTSWNLRIEVGLVGATPAASWRCGCSGALPTSRQGSVTYHPSVSFFFWKKTCLEQPPWDWGPGQWVSQWSEVQMLCCWCTVVAALTDADSKDCRFPPPALASPIHQWRVKGTRRETRRPCPSHQEGRCRGRREIGGRELMCNNDLLCTRHSAKCIFYVLLTHFI